jgi:hypothetical protein
MGKPLGLIVGDPEAVVEAVLVERPPVVGERRQRGPRRPWSVRALTV